MRGFSAVLENGVWKCIGTSHVKTEYSGTVGFKMTF